jgi:PDZ domain
MHGQNGSWSKAGCFRTALLVLTTTCLSGCLPGKAFWQKHMSFSESDKFTMNSEWHKEGAKPPLEITEQQITNSMIGTATNGATRVSYGTNLQAHAAIVAQHFEQALADTEHLLDTPIPLRPHIYLMRLPDERRVVRSTIVVPAKERTVPWVFVITNAPPAVNLPTNQAAELIWADLQEFPLFLFVLTHECREFGLIYPELLVLPDLDAAKGFLHFHLKYHTRWFRDGFANYTGYQASQSFRRNLTRAGLNAAQLRFCEDSLRPFTKLAKIRDQVFDWNQKSETGEDDDDYEAAMALFLLIEQRKGTAAITEIVRALPGLKSPNGEGLLRMVSQKTGIDLLRLAKDFQFPDLGLNASVDDHGNLTVGAVAAGSWAERAGLARGDLLIELNGKPLQGTTSLELQILNACSGRESITFRFLRNEQSYYTQKLPVFSL